MGDRNVTVFGGRGFPGRRLARSLRGQCLPDTVASVGMPGIAALGIAPQRLEHGLEQILAGVKS